MRWKGRRSSENVEDRRGMGPGRVMVGGGIGLLLVVLVVTLLGGNPGDILSQLGGGGGGGGAPSGGGAQAPRSAEEEELFLFVSVVLADTEDVWDELFASIGKRYEHPKLVVFTDAVQSACGAADAAVGPFYCPGDRQVYIDLSFYDLLKKRFRAAGDFAQAYVLAHEVGHHVQNLLGISARMEAARRRLGADTPEYNALSVRLELQADFLAGVWAHHAQRMKHVLDPGDIDEAIRAAGAIGDDAIQRQTQGRVVPDAFTHGTSAQRIAWFRHGFETGDLGEMDTFDDDQFRRVSPR